MRQITSYGLIFALAIVTLSLLVLAEDRKANELLQSGITKETIQGDIGAAIGFYERAVKEAGANRALAARAQLRLAAAYAKQGNEKARSVLERLVRDYADQRGPAAEAQMRLAALASAKQTPVTTQTNTIGGLVQTVTIQTLPQATERQITLFDPQGKMLGVVGDFGYISPGFGAITISPDGRRVAVTRDGIIMVFDIATKVVTPITAGPLDGQPTWSPDGSRIAYQNSRGVFITDSNGGQREELVYPRAPLGDSFTLVSWTQDGGFLTFQQRGGGMGFDLWVLPLGGDRKPVLILSTPAADTGPRLSPDGRYLSYRSNESGRSELYVRPFSLGTNPVPLPNAPKWRVSADHGVAPAAGVRWRSDGKEMYYISTDGAFMAVDVSTTPTFTAGTPRLLFKLPAAFQAVSNTAGYSDVSPDGKIFLLYMPR